LSVPLGIPLATLMFGSSRPSDAYRIASPVPQHLPAWRAAYALVIGRAALLYWVSRRAGIKVKTVPRGRVG